MHESAAAKQEVLHGDIFSPHSCVLPDLLLPHELLGVCWVGAFALSPRGCCPDHPQLNRLSHVRASSEGRASPHLKAMPVLHHKISIIDRAKSLGVRDDPYGERSGCWSVWVAVDLGAWPRPPGAGLGACAWLKTWAAKGWAEAWGGGCWLSGSVGSWSICCRADSTGTMSGTTC